MRVGLRREVGADAREQRLERDVGELRVQRAGLEPRQVEQLREQRLRAPRPTNGCWRAAAPLPDRAPWPASAAANSPIACSGWRRSWLAAARNWLFARLAVSAAARADSARLSLRFEFVDQVDVLVAHGERVREHVVQLVAEAKHEYEHDQKHERGEQMHLVALEATRAISGTSAASAKP